MTPRAREALSQAVTMAALMFVLRRLGTLLPYEWARQTWDASFVFALTFGLMWGVITWAQHPKMQAQREARERRAREAKKQAQRKRWR
ncbi:MAG: hypothetical protein Q4P32_00960 [Micrococcales bacterium]|nr:hypothetical protein [Micrococcales bacterium]